jgi:hypothetical protein
MLARRHYRRPSQEGVLRKAFRKKEKESGSGEKEKQKLKKIRNESYGFFVQILSKKVEATMERTLKMLAKEAKMRMKKGFWEQCEEELSSSRSHAKEQGINESKMERYFQEKVTTQIKGETPDEFYLKVRDLLLSEGEVSNAIGRLTDKAYYDTLSYAEKQRYTLELSERYLHALERFKHEYEFELKGRS